MVRKQIQLTDTQASAIQSIAEERHVSVATLIREGIDFWLRAEILEKDEELRQRALSVAGRFASGTSDLSANHDDYLSEDLGR